MWDNDNSETQRLDNSRPNIFPTKRRQRNKRSCLCFSLIVAIIITTLIIVSFIIFKLNTVSAYPDDKWKVFHDENYIPPELSKKSCKLIYDEIKSYNNSYEKSINADMINLLFNQSFVEKFNDSSVFYKAREVYSICKKTKKQFYEQLIDNMTADVFKSHSGKSVTESIVYLLKEFNFNTFFNIEIMPNMGEGMAMAIYLSPNPAFYEETERQEYTKIPPEAFKLYQKLRNISEAPDDTSKWKTWNLNSSKDFNFTIFFDELLMDQPLANLTDFKFSVTNPDYIQKLEKVLIETSPLEMQALFLTALKDTVMGSDCDEIIEDYMPHISNILYLSINNDTVIKESKNRVIVDFQKLIESTKSLVQPYLHTVDQQNLAEEKLKNVELTTEAPNWLQLDDVIDRLNAEYQQLSPKPTILELRKFAFQQKLSKFEATHEALRSFEHDSIPVSSNKMFYSEMGNWLTIPIATFMQYNYGSRDRAVLKLAINIAKIVSFDSFRWSSTGTQKNFENEILPLNLKEQNFCYRIHGISEEDYSISMGLEAAWQLLTDGLTGIEKRYVTKKLAQIVLEKNTTSTIRIAAAFSERHHENLCKNENILPCFI